MYEIATPFTCTVPVNIITMEERDLNRSLKAIGILIRPQISEGKYYGMVNVNIPANFFGFLTKFPQDV